MGGSMTVGIAAAFCGGWQYGMRTRGFRCGVAAYTCFHVIWSAANWKKLTDEEDVEDVVRDVREECCDSNGNLVCRCAAGQPVLPRESQSEGVRPRGDTIRLTTDGTRIS